jgi:hypothetical protein
VPSSGDGTSNQAYFVYDGVPGWKGAINPQSREASRSAIAEFPPTAMLRVQVYHLIAKDSEIKNATWYERDNVKDYKYFGTLVADGQVYDHVGFRARGGVWRHAMGKNMWKISFNKGNSLRAKDDYGRPYPARWSKLNLRACIQQGDYGARGEQGMFEAVGFRLFNLAGTESPFTHWVHWRVVTTEQEAPASQYEGDFWGLYLAIENEDGSFLKDHSLPDGNVYKMMNGQGELAHQGGNSVTNHSDIQTLLSGFAEDRPAAWWSTTASLDRYYSYRAILEGIHHYDVDAGKNYTFYFNPETRKAQVVPWDIDLTWDEQMYGAGQEPMLQPVLSQAGYRREYRNRLREIRDLLFNPEQTGRLIDECAAVIWDASGKPSMVEADRRKWDHHPIMESRHVLTDKAGKGKFYLASPTRDFGGMVQLMKAWVETRSAWIDSHLLKASDGPATPKLELAGQTDGSSKGDPWTLRCSEYQGAAPFAAQQWRLAEVAPPGVEGNRPVSPGKYEITSIWQSGEQPVFAPTQNLPPGLVHAGATYRARVRVKDALGSWSHWSAPVEILGGREVQKP